MVDTRFLPGRRILLLILVCFISSGLDLGLTVYIVSSGSTVATGITSVVVVISGVVMGDGKVVGFSGRRRLGVG